MSDLRTRFEQAAKDVRSLPAAPDNATLLRLYALFKQGDVGDAAGDSPGAFDFIGVAKHEAWARLRGMPQEEAMLQYIELVQRLRG